MSRARPLEGLRVVELGQLLAGPFAGMMLGYFGADVVKVEPPGGDALRTWREIEGGTSLWWRSLARNKRSVVVDLRTDDGRGIVRDLCRGSDVLVENFRPGTMEAWGLGPAELFAIAPALVYARVSGFGQTGPYGRRAGFASVCEAAAGLRHLTGRPGEPPVRANLSLGDSLGGLHAVVGILLALEERRRSGRGQVVDVALTESIYGVLESVLVEYARLGVVRGPSGATITGVVPSNAYACSCGRLVVIGANTDKLFGVLARAIGRADLAEDPALAQNPGRVARAAEIDAAIEAWTRARPAEAVVAALEAAGVPAAPVNDAAAIVSDPQFAARGLLERVTLHGAPFELPAVAPRLEASPGRSDWAGPELGEHTDEVLGERLGLSAGRIAALRTAGVVA